MHSHTHPHTHKHKHTHTHMQGVQWILLRNPIFIYGEDWTALHKLMGYNFRPVQPLNGRPVTTTVAA